jgi:hypothetical protein
MTATPLGTIGTTLEQYKLPGGSVAYFAKVFKGMPSALAATGRPVALYHYTRSEPAPEGNRSLDGSTMREDVFTVECYWPLTPMDGAQQSQEDDIYAVCVDLPEQFIDTSGQSVDYGDTVTLATYDQASKISQLDFYGAMDVPFRVFRFDLHLRVLGGS